MATNASLPCPRCGRVSCHPTVVDAHTTTTTDPRDQHQELLQWVRDVLVELELALLRDPQESWVVFVAGNGEAQAIGRMEPAQLRATLDQFLSIVRQTSDRPKEQP